MAKNHYQGKGMAFEEGTEGGEQESNESSPRGVLEIQTYISSSVYSDNSCCSCSNTRSAERRVRHDGLRGEKPQSFGLKRLVKDVLGKKPALTSRRSNCHRVYAKGANKVLSRTTSADNDWSRIDDDRSGIDECEVVGKGSWRSFDYAELAAATDNFNPENLIGKGGHAVVYKGTLKDGQVVAVKKLKSKDGDGQQQDRTGAFLSELGMIGHVNHPNAVRLIGFSTDGGLFFVLEFCPHGSLASLLHGPSTHGVMEWKARFKVAVGVARGLQYLHHRCRRRIIHRDMKPCNILLGEDLEPKIADFGLAKWLPENWIHHVVSPIEGTIGYLAPEYFMHGVVDEKTDVFAFGVLLLEIITGRPAVVSTQQSLVMWAQPLLEDGNIQGLADPQLGKDYDVGEMRRAVFTASMCTHHISTSRPDMNQVVKTLAGQDGRVEDWKHESVSRTSFILSACDTEGGYDCADYLQDLNRHMKLLMET